MNRYLAHIAGVAIVVSCLGCATKPKAPRMGPDDYPNVAAFPAPPILAAANETPPSDPALEYLDLDDPALQEPIRQFRATGKPPVVRNGDSRAIRYPFGYGNPLLHCKPLRVCDLELQAGEAVLDVALGDTELWHANPMESGPPGLRTPHVIFKPTLDGISTNAIITTDRRVYHLGLVARLDETGLNDQPYVRHVSFYYPRDMVTAWTQSDLRRQQDRNAREARDREGRMHPPATLYRGYEISGDVVPWRPKSVFDDGTRVYIEMPPAMHVTEAPGLWIIDEHGQTNLVNYRVAKGLYVVDKLFAKAKLAIGTGKDADEIYVTRLRPSEATAPEPTAVAAQP